MAHASTSTTRARALLPAGLVDAGFASLATFAIGLFAARFFTAADLGAFALVFAVFLLLVVFPTQLVFVPAEVAALEVEAPFRPALVLRSIRLALPLVVLAAAASPLALLFVGGDVADATVVALVAGAGATVLVSPVQDHVRRMLHLGGRSWAAAAMSVSQFAVAAVALVVLTGAGVSKAWVPFAALAAANVVSTTIGLALAMRGGDRSLRTGHGFGDLVRSGRWLLVAGLAPQASLFLVAVLVTRLAGSEALGYAEGARVVAQPIFVLALGVYAVLGPRALETGARRERAASAALSRLFNTVVIAAAVPYALVVGFDWGGNPLADLIPNAYFISELILVSIAANVINGFTFLYRSELIGGGMERQMARAELGANFLSVVSAFTARITESYARPLAFVVQGVVRFLIFARQRVELYGPKEGAP